MPDEEGNRLVKSEGDGKLVSSFVWYRLFYAHCELFFTENNY